MQIFEIRDGFIKLGQALKAAGFVESGVDAKFAVQDGLVKVNGKRRPHAERSLWTEMWWNMTGRSLR